MVLRLKEAVALAEKYKEQKKEWNADPKPEKATVKKEQIPEGSDLAPPLALRTSTTSIRMFFRRASTRIGSVVRFWQRLVDSCSV